MRISLNWLKEYVDIPVDADELAHKMTMLGLEIEAIERPWSEAAKVHVGEILAIGPHPDADKLVVCKTDVGQGQPLQIVCGAKNMKVGDRVPTALVGATLPGGFQISGRKMRGVASEGMMCSARELGLGEDHDGLLILDPQTPVGADFVRLLGLDDVIFETEVTPNRGDWASVIGVARELAALFGVPCRIPKTTIQESGQRAAGLSSVTVEDPDLCPRYAGRVLTSAQVAASPLWMRCRLLAVGQRPINNLVDITNYVLLETGHPLHAFDYDLLAENRIVVRRSRPGETIVTIDGQSHTLAPEILVIADARRPVAVAGVMGGQASEVGGRTTRVFLESAYFDPVSVRRTSRSLGLQTEAALHFQRGADPEMVLYAVNRAAALMQELAGAEVAQGVLDEYPTPLQKSEVRLRYQRTNLLLGTPVPPETQKNVLLRLGFDAVTESEGQCAFRVPSWRHDVTQEADLIEEVARLYGYERINVALPSIRQTETVFAPDESRLRKFRAFLVGLGLTEMMHWTFTSPEEVRRCALEGSYLDMVALRNPLSENQATLRSSLVPGLMANVARNLNHGNRNILAFELGPVYIPAPGKELSDEPVRVAVVLTGQTAAKHWSRPQRPVDFYDLKGYVEAILEFFGANGEFTEVEMPLLQPGQCGQVMVEKQRVGFLGSVAVPVLKAYDIDQPAFILECDVQELLKLERPAAQFQALAQFPPSLRDMAVLVDAAVPAGDIRDAARQAGGKLLKSVDIFDVYTGKQVPPGKKSVALSLVFQSDERTLTDKDTQKTWDKILRKLEEGYQAELR
jgi:phenylalanyl-tRNA synthetase beta chain